MSVSKNELPKQKALSIEGAKEGQLDFVFNMLWRKTKEFENCKLASSKSGKGYNT